MVIQTYDVPLDEGVVVFDNIHVRFDLEAFSDLGAA